MTSEQLEQALAISFGMQPHEDESSFDFRRRIVSHATVIETMNRKTAEVIDSACLNLYAAIGGDPDLVPTLPALVLLACRQLEDERSKARHMVAWLHKVKDKLDAALEMTSDVLDVENDDDQKGTTPE